ncbi:hypothetical protein K488DRAFT_74816 [Vararia minispora EC-137]|uniref:Uncharacterized protein n=1 Tax=Vararia minispora EC-137 TaxID=1314806 RepID=A0ACB8Q5P4_9AGAM|nr:hypothetical protein K488DRAFT_74816 [Vararia minispora EC-137]
MPGGHTDGVDLAAASLGTTTISSAGAGSGQDERLAIETIIYANGRKRGQVTYVPMGWAPKQLRAPLKAKNGSTAEPSRAPTEQSNDAANLQCRGRLPSIKSKDQCDWLEDHRPVYERTIQKGRKATSDFLSSTTTAFLDKFGWTNTHFVMYNGEEQTASHKETDAAMEQDEAQTATIYKLV